MSKQPVKRTGKGGKRPRFNVSDEYAYAWKLGMFKGMVKAECDILTALGRLGWRDGRMRQLSAVLSDVRKEAAASDDEDRASGDYMRTTQYMYSREMRQYAGEKAVTDWDQVFDPSEVTWGFRVFELYDRTHNEA